MLFETNFSLEIIPFQEIRLFKLDSESETVYDDLLSKLIDCYKTHGQVDCFEYDMFWIDGESDEIRVSSNGELSAALDDIPTNETFKINVNGISPYYHQSPYYLQNRLIAQI